MFIFSIQNAIYSEEILLNFKAVFNDLISINFLATRSYINNTYRNLLQRNPAYKTVILVVWTLELRIKMDGAAKYNFPAGRPS